MNYRLKHILKISFLTTLLLCSIAQTNAQTAVWQWSAAVPNQVSDETGKPSQAFLWIPDTCTQVRGIVFGQHNMCEEPIFCHPAFRAEISRLGFAIVWVTPLLNMPWNVDSGVQQSFDSLLCLLADESGYTELKTAPIVPLGHSACATFPWNFAAWNPQRTLAVISYKGDAPRTNLCGYGGANLEWGRTRNIDGIPGLMIEGEYEWWEARVSPALSFKMKYPNSCISFLADAGRGHFDVSDAVVDYICLFLRKAAEARLPNMQPLDVRSGWLVERWHPDLQRDRLPEFCELCADQADKKIVKRSKPAQYAKYKGCRSNAFWYFDQETALAAEQHISTQYAKQEQFIGFTQQGCLLPFDANSHARIVAQFLPQADGLTFYLSAALTDSARQHFAENKTNSKVDISRICGPVEQINDTTFRVNFYYMGMDNPRRTPEIWLVAAHQGDKSHKSAVQQLLLKIPYRINNGSAQNIDFKPINANENPIKLTASATSGLPVNFYVKEGAAQIINGNELQLLPIPPRAKKPMKITVVAWQYGISELWNTAEPVEQTFLYSE